MTRFCFVISCMLAALPLFTGGARAQELQATDSTIAVPTAWDTYYVVLLREGPDYAAERPADEAQDVMNRHIQYQLRLQQTGQAIAGGGFGQVQDGIIGLTLLRVDSLEEAELLARSDPAVEAGRLTAVVYAWYVPAGRMPE